MSVHTRPGPFPVGFLTWPVCFTGGDAYLFGTLFVLFEAVFGAFVGAVAGVLVSLVFGPEVVPQLAGALVGALIGGAVGAAYGVMLITKGSCPCPAGTTGFCVCFLLFMQSGARYPVIVPPAFIPCPGECAPPPTGTMPAGCP